MIYELQNDWDGMVLAGASLNAKLVALIEELKVIWNSPSSSF
jgi:hypothetical protein